MVTIYEERGKRRKERDERSEAKGARCVHVMSLPLCSSYRLYSCALSGREWHDMRSMHTALPWHVTGERSEVGGLITLATPGAIPTIAAVLVTVR